jgi:hypothetical protein
MEQGQQWPPDALAAPFSNVLLGADWLRPQPEIFSTPVGFSRRLSIY